MSTIAYPPPPPPSAVRPTSSIATTIVGSILIVVGALTAISGAALLILFGSDRTLAATPHHIETSTSALVTDLGTITNTQGVSVVVASPTLEITARGTTDAAVFVGIGPAKDVDRYLAGIAADRITDLDLSPFFLTTQRQDGSLIPESPAAQDFWVASAQASDVADLTWQMRDGNYSIVIMNADGSPGVDSQVQVGVGLAGSTPLWYFVIFVGAVFMAIGTIVIVVGSRRRNVTA